MWILPSQLLNSAPGMAALDLDSKTSLASDCEPSHIVSLRGSLKPISSVKWKKDSWMSHLFGTILKPSHTESFTDWWISSFLDIHVNHFPAQENEQEKKTQDISGLGSQMEFDFFSQECASLKMSRDTFRWDSPQSSVIWKNWVTKVRSEYSVRVKLAQSTKGKESLSWPTAATRDFKGESGSGRQERKGHPADTLPNAVAQWPTPTAGECLDQGTNWETLARLDKGGRILRRMASLEMSGPHAPANHNTHGNRQESWPTPTALNRVRDEETMEKCLKFRQGNGQTSVPLYLEEKVNLEEKSWRTPSSSDEDAKKEANWATPQASDHVEGARTELTSNQKCLGRDMKQWATPIVGDSHLASTPEVAAKRIAEGKTTLSRQNAGKLNQRWVETLMGLPMGWTSPSCPASVIRNWPKFVSGWLKATTAQTNYDPAEMELFQLQQKERSES